MLKITSTGIYQHSFRTERHPEDGYARTFCQFSVWASDGDRTFVHRRDFSHHFDAATLRDRVQAAGTINPVHWDDRTEDEMNALSTEERAYESWVIEQEDRMRWGVM